MKKLFSAVFVICTFSLFGAFVSSLGGSIDSGGLMNLTIAPGQHPPLVFVDFASTLWLNSTPTSNTAGIYGIARTNVHGDTSVDIPQRYNYAFEGEIFRYYIVVEDGDGIADISSVNKLILKSANETGAGACAPVADFLDFTGFGIVDYHGDPLAYDNATMGSYICELIIAPSWTGQYEVFVRATDQTGLTGDSNMIHSIYLNPTIELTLDGSINFGSVKQGTTSISNSVYIRNDAAPEESAVVLDMYISSDNFFTDPINASATCGTSTGIPHTSFGYYATKGYLNSGGNDNGFPGVGNYSTDVCVAGLDGFTNMTVESLPSVSNMCRIINSGFEDSLLTQDSEMSLTFQLDVPTPCEGTFTDGKFYFVGEVV